MKRILAGILVLALMPDGEAYILAKEYRENMAA